MPDDNFDPLIADGLTQEFSGWQIPDFTVGKYRNRLRALHERVEKSDGLVAHRHRFYIEARKPNR